GVQVLRRRLLAQARGRVLEVAVGTGRNLRHYPPHCTITALDFSLPMLREAKRRVAAHRCRAALHLMDAE
ncbi:MAG: class I SAM-dependent methyltransferase, partial [Gammaproteobacteria bacterium]|nr:class I SAM-dependent methyltransferase [Gammaproteobacteria bacterium]NIR96882.1 class I SAM-dependent methyltransferase [Gammaproteobacteria bacterium]NIT64291.1 class I SAM-dependent methyltransferase [Gammaproteobacteria bacterium]NIV19537.1 methyltransferase domain-containing protein [Gammaproteobacteria bacterium]NIY32871.1 methyltransferase domain-containing protein [Gammaproteobacteria bacterium]